MKRRSLEEFPAREAPKSAAPQGGKEKTLFLLLITVLVLFFITTAFLLFGKDLIARLPTFAAGDKTVEAGPQYQTGLKEFQVNLADNGARRYLRVKLVLGYDARSLQKEIERRENEMRSAIITLLRGKTVADLDEPGGAVKLQADLMAEVNRFLATGEIEAIYFDELIIQ